MSMTPLPPGLLIAAPRSGSGKTTVTLGLMRAFRQQGLAVGALKCGPDYIDPAFHAAACGRPSVNVDGWAMGDDLIHALATSAGQGADIVLGEGLMGLFDGVPAAEGRTGSSADVAVTLGLPVLLVLDVSGQSQSAGAVALGCARFDPRLEVAGVILNKVGSERHIRLARQAVEQTGLSVLGALPRRADLVLPERHLGLVQAGETDGLEAILDAMATFVGEHCDLEAIRVRARAKAVSAAPVALRPPAQRIALAQDRAFSFLYPHLLQLWRAAGAQILPFSPLADEAPPQDADLCWLPGGYPELHAGELAEKSGFLRGLRAFAESKPVHGECGGYMVLGESLTDAQGQVHRMAGLLSVETSFFKRKMNLGYRRATLLADGPLGCAGETFSGHEFHYASIVASGSDAAFARLTDAYGSPPFEAGHCRGRVSGSFFHIIAPV